MKRITAHPLKHTFVPVSDQRRVVVAVFNELRSTPQFSTWNSYISRIYNFIQITLSWIALALQHGRSSGPLHAQRKKVLTSREHFLFHRLTTLKEGYRSHGAGPKGALYEGINSQSFEWLLLYALCTEETDCSTICYWNFFRVVDHAAACGYEQSGIWIWNSGICRKHARHGRVGITILPGPVIKLTHGVAAKSIRGKDRQHRRADPAGWLLFMWECSSGFLFRHHSGR